MTYNALIRVTGNSRRAESLLHVFQAMRRQGVVPDLLSYNALIDAFAKGRLSGRPLEAF